jgi:hypothetical protein
MITALAPEHYVSRRLRFRDLQVFFAVVQSGSMAKAAQQLGLTQPAVSDIVAALEEMFGVRLFDRNSRGGRADNLCPGIAQTWARGFRRTQTRNKGH